MGSAKVESSINKPPVALVAPDDAGRVSVSPSLPTNPVTANTVPTDDEDDDHDDLLVLVPCGSGDIVGIGNEQKQTKSNGHNHGHHHHQVGDCDAVLEVQDSFVSCVEGVSMQHDHESKSDPPISLVDRVLPDGGPHLSVKEASMIRQQAMEQHQQRLQQQTLEDDRSSSNNGSTTLVVDGMPEVDFLDLNLCGSDIDDPTKGTKRVVTPNAEEQKEEQGVAAVEAERTTPGTPSHTTENNECDICSDQIILSSANQLNFANLPCCGKSTTGDGTTAALVCSACVVLLTQPTSDGASRVGRCPRCRSWITVKTPTGDVQMLDITMVGDSGFCRTCRQPKNYLVDQGACDACFLGGRNPLLYECEQCHGTQRIPHPMYRYQATPGDYTTKTWSCEGPCQFMTHWRLRHDQLPQVPMGDAPWPETDWKAHAKEHVCEARRTLQVEASSSDQCIIL